MADVDPSTKVPGAFAQTHTTLASSVFQDTRPTDEAHDYPQTPLHPRAQDPLATHTARQGKQTEEETGDENDCEYYARHILKDFYAEPTHDYTREQILAEADKRFSELSDKYFKDKTEPITPFQRMGNLSSKFPTTGHTITGPEFIKLVNDHPVDMFHQFRNRSIAYKVLLALVEQLNVLANNGSSDGVTLAKKIHQFADQVSSLKDQLVDATDNSILVQQMTEELEARNEEIKDLQEDITHLVKENRKAKIEPVMTSAMPAPSVPVKEPTTTPPMSPDVKRTSIGNKPVAPPAMDTAPIPPLIPIVHDTVTIHDQSPDRSPSPLPAPRGRSAKADPPPVFTNDKPTGDKAEVKFKAWFLLLKAKLQKNRDHFDNDKEIIDYIVGRTGGSAMEALLPWVTPNFRNQTLLKTSAEVLSHLYEQYHDPNEYETARLKYRDLKMLPSDKFTNFRIEFTRWASQAGVQIEDMKRDLHDKLPKRLNEHLVRDAHDTAVSYEAYCRAAMTIDYQQQRNFTSNQVEKEKKTTATAPTTTLRRTFNTSARPRFDTVPSAPAPQPSSGTNHYGVRVKATARDGHPIYHRPTPEQIRMLLTRGQCFLCHEPGHRTSECKYKDELAGLNAARINEIAARMGFAEESKDVAQDN